MTHTLGGWSLHPNHVATQSPRELDRDIILARIENLFPHATPRQRRLAATKLGQLPIDDVSHDVFKSVVLETIANNPDPLP